VIYFSSYPIDKDSGVPGMSVGVECGGDLGEAEWKLDVMDGSCETGSMSIGEYKDKSEIRGSLHCATDDETVHRSGRDDGSLNGAGTRPEGAGVKPAIWIRPLLAGEDTTAFRTLNEEWIMRHFALEEKDRETLGDPEGVILKQGGHIFMVWTSIDDEDEAVGCVALIAMGDGVYELSKMAVSPKMRGMGVGRKMLEHAVAQAKEIGAKRLFLGSNSKLADAVHLYESVGFEHLPEERRPRMPYRRANVFMEMEF
jgi:putative acetyltransferase